ncbi:MAG: hypothetical protein IPI97_03595 [Nitrosomonas sp.]|jgi:hypothetical protein|nr:hypothetical protein [Nitrosomonas sp.]MBK7364121.1 hypothetical protein [Nitrosomonas sp.]
MKKIIISTLICFFVLPLNAADETDNRKALLLSEVQRHHVLSEMRSMLLGTQQIIQAVAEDDMLAVARHARMLGMEMAHKGEDHLQSVLPDDFMQLGMSVHKSFDKIATDAEILKDSKHTLSQLSITLQQCVTCHSAYQIWTTDIPVDAEPHPAHQLSH